MSVIENFYLIISSKGSQYNVDIIDLNVDLKLGAQSLTYSKKPLTHSNKPLTYSNKPLISVNNYEETIGIYEKYSTKFDIFSSNGIGRSSFDTINQLDSVSFYQDRWLFGSDNSGRIYLYDIRKRRMKKCLNETNYIRPGIEAISINDIHVYSLHENGKISSLNMKSLESKSLLWAGSSISTITANPFQNNSLLSGFKDGTVMLYDTARENVVAKWSSHENKVNCLSFSQYNDRLMLSCSDDKSVILYGTDEKRPLKELNAKTPVNACAMSDDVLFAYGDADKVVIYDLRNTVSPVKEYQNNNNEIDFLQFTSKNRPKDISHPLLDSESCIQSSSYLSENLSGSSIFSGDDNHAHKAPIIQPHVSISSNDSLDFSCIRGPSVVGFHSHNIEGIIKQKGNDDSQPMKHVNFHIPKQVVAMPIVTPLGDCSDSLKSESFSATTPSVPAGDNIVGGSAGTLIDYSFVRTLVRDEVRQQLLQMEGRLKNEIMMSMVDQLNITEQNMLTPLQAAIQGLSEKIAKESEELKWEVSRAKFTF